MTAISSSKERAARTLWKLVFVDSDAFIDSYFSQVYRDEDTLIIDSPEGALSQVQVPRMHLADAGSLLPVGYVTGVSTRPEARGRGLMRELMHSTLRLEQQRGDVLSVLIPAEEWLYDYYQRVGGYVPYFAERITSDHQEALLEPDESYCRESLLDYLVAVETARHGVHLLQSRAFLSVVLEDYAADESTYFYTHQRTEGLIDGALFVMETPEALLVRALYGTAPVRESLIGQLEQSATKPIRYYLRPLAGQPQRPKGMLRIIDLEAFIRWYAASHPEVSLSFTFRDQLFPTNEGSYIIASGRVERLPLTEAHHTLSQSALLSALYPEGWWTMHLMLEGLL